MDYKNVLRGCVEIFGVYISGITLRVLVRNIYVLELLVRVIVVQVLGGI